MQAERDDSVIGNWSWGESLGAVERLVWLHSKVYRDMQSFIQWSIRVFYNRNPPAIPNRKLKALGSSVNCQEKNPRHLELSFPIK